METIEQSRNVEKDIPPLPSSLYSPPTSPFDSKPLFSSSQTTRKPRINPLVDLIESEKVYVSSLKIMLQRITSCWDSDNLPPTEIDKMFRLIESIYKRNRKFCTKLVKIGVNLNKELGDILMIWVNDMEKPYTNFCINHKEEFDQRPEIKGNVKLQQVLKDLSIQRNQQISLDYLFEMPIYRLHYYKKFYLRLLKSSDPGRSDHDTLENANKRIDIIIKMIGRIPITIDTKTSISESSGITELIISENLADFEEFTAATNSPSFSPTSNYTSSTTTPTTPIPDLFPTSINNTTPDTPNITSPPNSVFTTPTMTSTDSSESSIFTSLSNVTTSETISMPITPTNSTSPIPAIDAINIEITTNIDDISFSYYEQGDLYPDATSVKSPIDVKIEDFSSSLNFEVTINNLESVIDNSRTMDLFTKQPKNAKLILLPPNLPFDRQILFHQDLVIEIPDFDEYRNPKKTLLEVHLFILTDLILICQIYEDEDKAKNPNFEYWLLFAPISVRNLMIKDLSDDQGDMLEIVVPGRGSFVVYSAGTEDHYTLSQVITNAIMFANKVTTINPPDINNNIRRVGSNPQLYNSSLSPGVLRRSPSADILSLNPNLPSPNNYMNSGLSSPTSSLLSTPPKTPPKDYNYINHQIASRAISRSSSRSSSISSSSGFTLRRAASTTSLSSVKSISAFKETIYQSPICEVETWYDNGWKPLTKKDNCIVEVRLTTSNKGCWAIILPNSSRMVLNAWIHVNTNIHQENQTCIVISSETAQKKELHRISFSSATDAVLFHSSLIKAKQYSKDFSPVTDRGFMSRTSSLQDTTKTTAPVVMATNQQQKVRELEQEVTVVLESKCRLFLQNDHGVWTNLGRGQMEISLETPSYRKRIVVNSDKQKTKIIDSIIWECGVERVGKAGVAITINRMGPPTPSNTTNRAIYMLKMKDEKAAIEACDVMKDKKPNL